MCRISRGKVHSLLNLLESEVFQSSLGKYSVQYDLNQLISLLCESGYFCLKLWKMYVIVSWTDQQRAAAAKEGWQYRLVFSARLVWMQATTGDQSNFLFFMDW